MLSQALTYKMELSVAPNMSFSVGETRIRTPLPLAACMQPQMLWQIPLCNCTAYGAAGLCIAYTAWILVVYTCGVHLWCT